jgi:hypothetical protein
MLFRGSTNWAQTCWWKKSNGTREAFVQWTAADGVGGTEVFPGSPVGTFQTYLTIYNPASGGTNSEFVFERNNSVLWRVRPATFEPNAVQANGEAHNDRNQMPGGFTLRTSPVSSSTRTLTATAAPRCGEDEAPTSYRVRRRPRPRRRALERCSNSSGSAKYSSAVRRLSVRRSE